MGETLFMFVRLMNSENAFVVQLLYAAIDTMTRKSVSKRTVATGRGEL